MTVKKGANNEAPQTLMQAHEELVRIRPRPQSSLPVWLSYYRRSVEVYQNIARSDPTHEGEALYWAQREQARAESITARIKEDYAKPSLKKYKPTAARNEDKKVFSGLL